MRVCKVEKTTVNDYIIEAFSPSSSTPYIPMLLIPLDSRSQRETCVQETIFLNLLCGAQRQGIGDVVEPYRPRAQTIFLFAWRSRSFPSRFHLELEREADKKSYTLSTGPTLKLFKTYNNSSKLEESK